MRIALGTIPFGTTVDEATSFAILDRFVERGGTITDTVRTRSSRRGDAGLRALRG
ncbi:hypothetical protein ACFHYQ_11595 [Sphaerimonospora cavernae]|uniref:Uncharacterized protein n=1 Tax=Sphaerimonospora cavernae TaxID=1740611 RepID=A0ABV6U3B4_9ACTN